MKFDPYRHTKYIFLTTYKNKDLRGKTKTVKILFFLFYFIFKLYLTVKILEDNIGVKPS